MSKFKIFVAESVSYEDFYARDWEGYVVEEIVRLIGGRTFYKIAMTKTLLQKAIIMSSINECKVFHLSCHGNNDGVVLTDDTHISWKQLSEMFQEGKNMPSLLTLSSCLGGDRGIAEAFAGCVRRPVVIIGAEAQEERDLLTFPGAGIAWSLLYTDLIASGMSRAVFMQAIKKMNHISPHKFVYRRWDEDCYRRFPSP